jgi:hypothetical protein
VAQCPLDAKAILAWGNMRRKQMLIVVIGSLGTASGRPATRPERMVLLQYGLVHQHSIVVHIWASSSLAEDRLDPTPPYARAQRG